MRAGDLGPRPLWRRVGGGRSLARQELLKLDRRLGVWRFRPPVDEGDEKLLATAQLVEQAFLGALGEVLRAQGDDFGDGVRAQPPLSVRPPHPDSAAVQLLDAFSECTQDRPYDVALTARAGSDADHQQSLSALGKPGQCADGRDVVRAVDDHLDRRGSHGALPIWAITLRTILASS